MIQTVAIVGVGLIGGSFALAMRKAGFRGRILGVSSPRTIEEARRVGVIDEAAPLEQAAARADLIYLSHSISRILATIPKLDAIVKPDVLVTDAGSTKARIVQTARETLSRAAFLGGHPMAGKESRGAASADPELFRNRPYVLTPTSDRAMEHPLAREFAAWIEKIGAQLLLLTPEQHDRVVACASHLPQLASTALAATLGQLPDQAEIRRAAGPGLEDVTRLALSPYDIWGDILTTNSNQIEEALSAYIKRLEQLRASLPDAATQFAEAARFARELRRASKKS
ncbi:MAG: prephenate dehydrogenase [bacterium]|nr:prephenate dehydrogenase [bacterium]